ncbi:hypothetical protein [Caloramator sp. Dgby_cultured_2]|uniref:hypothetical protein n=1 Tax=Caloramator sp. Dgby_cultured_2 TaxID=3029174 RepID=UPI00237DFB04|nr:hypothetical protein [Caloramator sp. Dgby_cultured_2]WDU83115.1 hypothetical protein PWK10_17400 [Caloramator sp. Dgby_cultured_2]
MEDLKFAIDIGTRTVIGVAYYVEDGKRIIKDIEIEEHKKGPCLMDKSTILQQFLKLF